MGVLDMSDLHAFLARLAEKGAFGLDLAGDPSGHQPSAQRTGIFWHEDTAEAMIMIRAYYKAPRWNELAKLACAAPLDALQ